MLRVSICPTDLATIHHDRFYHPQPHIMMRMHTLALHHKGESAARIAILLDRNPKTIRACLRTYQEGGLQAVYQYEKHKHECKLDSHASLIEQELGNHPPQSSHAAGALIETLTGIKRSPTQVRAFLKKRGISV
jgi:transposase